MAEGLKPTPEEWLDQFLALDKELQLKQVTNLLDWASKGLACREMDHEPALVYAEKMLDLAAWLLAEKDYLYTQSLESIEEGLRRFKEND